MARRSGARPDLLVNRYCVSLVLGQVASQTRYLWSQGCEAYFLYVEHPWRPSNEVWRRELPQHP